MDSRALALILFLAPACAPSPDRPAVAEPVPASAPSACERLRGARFRERAAVAADGSATLQLIDFAENGKSYSWTQGGTRATSSCECRGNTIQARGTTLSSDTDVMATYDAERDVLLWQGVEFERVAEPER